MKVDGSVVTWGNEGWGGDSSDVSAQLSGGVQSVLGNRFAFAAMKVDGSVVTWGKARWGGDSSSVATQLSGGVKSLVGNRFAFAAVAVDGSVITWGAPNSGGDSSGVASQLSGSVNDSARRRAYHNGGVFHLFGCLPPLHDDLLLSLSEGQRFLGFSA